MGRTDASGFRMRFAASEADVAQAVALRSTVFRAGRSDADRFDRLCRHLLIEDKRDGHLVATLRMMRFASGTEIGTSYAAQVYELGRLQAFPGSMLEIGRLCLAPGTDSPDVLRLILAALAGVVAEDGIELIFGCSSFAGVDPAPYSAAFALLRTLHLAPENWVPERKAGDGIALAEVAGQPDAVRGRAALPPLLRLYLGLGGWVSDHLVVDRDLNTLHVFTGLEIPKVPARRARVLRAMLR